MDMRVYRENLFTHDDLALAVQHCYDRLNALAKAGQSSRIGITGNPEARIKRYGYPYSGMELLWRTESEKYVRTLEEQLVERFRTSLDNEASGGGGDVQGPPYYLYVVH